MLDVDGAAPAPTIEGMNVPAEGGSALALAENMESVPSASSPLPMHCAALDFVMAVTNMNLMATKPMPGLTAHGPGTHDVNNLVLCPRNSSESKAGWATRNRER